MDKRTLLAELLEERRARQSLGSNIKISFARVALEDGRYTTCQHIRLEDGDWVNDGEKHEYDQCPHRKADVESSRKHLLVNFIAAKPGEYVRAS